MKSLPSSPRLGFSYEILNVLNGSEDVINNDLVKVDEVEEKDIQEIKCEYIFDDIKNKFDEGKVPEILELFYGGEDKEKFRINCEMFGKTGDNNLLNFFVRQK